jgi:hypothetical protein
MRGLMQQGRASRAASPCCIVATSPQNEKGSASVSPGRPQFIVPCLGTCLQSSSSFRCYRTDFAFGNPA